MTNHLRAISMTQAADLIERLAAPIPADMVMVPREPTEAMLNAFYANYSGVYTYRECCKALIAAAEEKK